MQKLKTIYHRFYLFFFDKANIFLLKNLLIVWFHFLLNCFFCYFFSFLYCFYFNFVSSCLLFFFEDFYLYILDVKFYVFINLSSFRNKNQVHNLYTRVIVIIFKNRVLYLSCCLSFIISPSVLLFYYTIFVFIINYYLFTTFQKRPNPQSSAPSATPPSVSWKSGASLAMMGACTKVSSWK